jgi:hypothetical protein
MNSTLNTRPCRVRADAGFTAVPLRSAIRPRLPSTTGCGNPPQPGPPGHAHWLPDSMPAPAMTVKPGDVRPPARPARRRPGSASRWPRHPSHRTHSRCPPRRAPPAGQDAPAQANSPPRQLTPATAHAAAGPDGDAMTGRRSRTPGSPLSAVTARAPRFIWGGPGPERTPAVRAHRGPPGRIRWPQAGPVPVSCSLAPTPASRARTPPMAGSWLPGSGSGGEPGSGSGCGGRLSASPRSRLGSGRDDAVGAALGAAGAGRESRSRTPGSRAMHSSNRARLVRTLQLAAPEERSRFLEIHC